MFHCYIEVILSIFVLFLGLRLYLSFVAQILISGNVSLISMYVESTKEEQFWGFICILPQCSTLVPS